MKLISQCLVCFGNQISKLMIKEEEKRRLFLEIFKFGIKYKNLFDDTPIELARIIYKNNIVIDFFKKEKKKEIQWSIKQSEKESDNLNLDELLKIATAANVFDFSAPLQLDWKKEINKIDNLVDLTKINGKLLYMTDNCSEIGFDLKFLEKLKQKKKNNIKITLMVRQHDFINDIAISDLKTFNLLPRIERIGKVIGLDIYGNSKSKNSVKIEDLKKYIETFDWVIAKGQANYEILTEYKFKTPVIFATVTKCQVIAKHIGLKEGKGIIKLYQTNNNKEKRINENSKNKDTKPKKQ